MQDAAKDSGIIDSVISGIGAFFSGLWDATSMLSPPSGRTLRHSGGHPVILVILLIIALVVAAIEIAIAAAILLVFAAASGILQVILVVVGIRHLRRHQVPSLSP
ncbi:MAG: hypothetical protein IPN01_38590 [Deltaproteobacteria bacterium]|nr:hypothetical protein [Deltaproteobacteria bacterium]